jgi:hypothetical protein
VEREFGDGGAPSLCRPAAGWGADDGCMPGAVGKSGEKEPFALSDNPFGTRLSPMSSVRTYVSGPDNCDPVPRKGFEPPTHALRMRCSTS